MDRRKETRQDGNRKQETRQEAKARDWLAGRLQVWQISTHVSHASPTALPSLLPPSPCTIGSQMVWLVRGYHVVLRGKGWVACGEGGGVQERDRRVHGRNHAICPHSGCMKGPPARRPFFSLPHPRPNRHRQQASGSREDASKDIWGVINPPGRASAPVATAP